MFKTNVDWKSVNIPEKHLSRLVANDNNYDLY